MKKILFLFLSLSLLISCDDGDITLESFNFNPDNVQKCTDNNLVFNTVGDELLLIHLNDTDFATLFENTITPDGVPRMLSLTGTSNQILYRKYSGTVSSNTICSVIPVSSPTVIKEWVATGGTLYVETDGRYDTSNNLIGYIHNIRFENINFQNPDNSFSFASYTFGNYSVTN